jgi:zinc protease
LIDMRFSKRYIAPVFTIFVLAVAGFAQPAATSAASVTEFEVNGLKVILKRRASAPTVSVGLFLRGGVRNLTDKTAGIEYLMLSSAVEAGQNVPRQTLRRELARTGSTLNASAASDFSVVALAATRENFDRIWKLFADVTMKPLFDAADVDRVREQMVTGLREQESVPDGALDTLEEQIIYAGHPYANDPSGTIATLSAITPAQLRDYHKRSMETSRLLLVVVGDIDAAELKTKVASTFATLPKGNYQETPLPALDFSKPSLNVVARPLPTNYIKGDFAAPPLNSPDYYPMRVAMSILASRIFEEVREKRQLSYAPNAEMGSLAANSANIYVTAVDANQAVEVMLKEIERIKRESVSSEELTAAASEFLTNYYLKQQTNAAQTGDLARYELIGGGWRNSFEFIPRIREVSPESIRAVANKYMKNIRFVVIGDPSAIDRSVFVGAQN